MLTGDCLSLPPLTAVNWADYHPPKTPAAGLLAFRHSSQSAGIKAEGRAALQCLLVHTSTQFAHTTAGAPKQQTPTMPAPAALLFPELKKS